MSFPTWPEQQATPAPIEPPAFELVESPVSEPGVSWQTFVQRSAALAPWVWVVGAPAMLGLLLTGLVGGERLRRHSRPVDVEHIRQLHDRLQEALRIGRRVGVAVCDRVAQPVLVGVVRPLILLPPAALTGWSPDQLEMVLLHELAHVRRWDNLVNLVQRLVESLLFFHPMVWVASGWVRRDREECCDALVVRHTGRPAEYAEVLVAVASGGPALIPASAMARTPLGHRVRRILNLEDEKMLISRKVVLATFAGILALTTALAWLPSEPQAADPPETKMAAEGPPSEDAWTENSDPSETEQPTSEARDPDDDPFDDASPRRQPPVEESPFSTERRVAAEPRSPIAAGVEYLKERHEGGEVGIVGSPARPPLLLSLEDQKIADKAYRMLGVELEPLDEDDLARVKKLGYSGGLKVVDVSLQSSILTPGKSGVSSRHSYSPFEQGDLLIGLHSWATTSLENLGKVLDRKDLQQLNPLKFYVVRQHAVEPPRSRPSRRGGQSMGVDAFGEPVEAQQEPKIEDRVVRGRISILTIKPTPTTGDYVAPGTVYPVVPSTLGPSSAPAPPVAPPRNSDKTPVYNSPRPGVPAPSTKSGDGFSPEPASPKPAPKMNNSTGEQPSVLSENHHLGENHPANVLNRGQVLYDGKRFDEWQNMWATELKTERRLECVRALAAFGRREQYAREAAKTILDVAGEYDFELFDNSDEGRLETAIVRLLSYDRPSIPEQYWLTELLGRYEKDPDRWRQVAYKLIVNVRLSDAALGEPLAKIAVEHKDPTLRNAAFRAVCRAASPVPEGQQMEVVRKALADPGLGLADNAVRRLLIPDEQGHTKLIWMEELYPLLFNDRYQYPAIVRKAMKYVSEDDAMPVAKRLLGELEETNPTERRLAAIRGLAAIGYKARDVARDRLLEMIDPSEDEAIRVAAAFGVDQMAERVALSGGWYRESDGTSALKALILQQDGGDPSSRQARDKAQTAASNMVREEKERVY